MIQTTRKLLNYQAPFQLEREPTSALAMVPYQLEKQRCIATCTTGSVRCKRERKKLFDQQESFINQKRDEEQLSSLT